MLNFDFFLPNNTFSYVYDLLGEWSICPSERPLTSLFSRFLKVLSSAPCPGRRRTRPTPSRTSASRRGPATAASVSPSSGARTAPRGPSGSTSRVSSPTDRPLGYSKKVMECFFKNLFKRKKKMEHKE